MKRFLVVVLLIAVLFMLFVYFGGGTAVKYLGEKTIMAGEYLENLETKIKSGIQEEMNRFQKVKKGLFGSST